MILEYSDRKICYSLNVCPFCGNYAAIHVSHRWPGRVNKAVKCYTPMCINTDCVIYGADNVYYRTKKEAIEKWNERSDVNQRR